MEYTRLGKSGLKISNIVFGTMSLGRPSDQMPWTIDAEQALPILKHAFDRGINTWDTADIYSYGDSERIVGQALKTYKIPRERVVILSKCYGGTPFEGEFDDLSEQERLVLMTQNTGRMVNRIGLSRKHIFDAVDASVERLGTYLDVLQIHRFDREAPREEIMKALNDVIESGKVRYIGASSMHAWEFQALNNVAEKNGWHKFISMQDYHSLLHREEEREMHPYCRDAGIGIIPWSPLARGLLARPFRSDAAKTEREKTDYYAQLLIGPTTEEDISTIRRVEELAQKHGCTMAQVSLAWSLRKGVNPIVGFTSIARVDEAVEAVKLLKDGLLDDGDMSYLEEPYIPKAVLDSAW
ncbi:unnamed protein product [Clonostachys rhizophaga]|uniref:NADP-dependent oxidoreductase domain-containing protein n=1 Tax=Clonostachys rhizophaga TaxID=160324 RepID=A0A9N9VH70_9HYPO|nr:unnamed protein product [Clonostachys rhizophaga]